MSRVRLLAVGPLVLLSALLPSLLYIDHWGEYLALTGAHKADADAASEHEAHAAHCHLGPGSCADQPAPLGPQGFAAVVELPAYTVVTVAARELERTLEGRYVRPLVEPPRSAWSIA